MKYHYLLFVVLLTFIFGCSKTSNPAAPAQTGKTVVGAGDFGFTSLGTSVQRAKDFNNNAIAYAQIYGNSSPKSLEIFIATRQGSQASFRDFQITFLVYGFSPQPGIYTISNSGAAPSATTTLIMDTVDYSVTTAPGDGGTLEITKFDTVQNLISGKFSFVATRTWPQTGNFPTKDTVTSGTFTDIGIAAGGYGQGSMSANIDGFLFDTRSDPGYTLEPHVIGSNTSLFLSASAPHKQKEDAHSLDVQIPFPPKTGTYKLSSDVTDSTARVIYIATIGGTYMSFFSDQNSTGNVIITKVDTTLHRIWGTFSYSGTDNNNSTVITGGVIDNLQWYKE
ncbi:MAG: hypothetical protein ACHQM6_06705 [Candidatus Kapaibacterium sp.]